MAEKEEVTLRKLCTKNNKEN